MLKNQQIFPRWATRKNELSADAGQQNLVEPVWLEKNDCNKSQALVFQDKDENGLELSLGLTYGSSQCKSIDAKRNMSDSQESRNNVKVSKMDGLGASSRSFLDEKSFQQECPRFRDGEVSKSFLVHEHDIHMINNAISFQDFNKKLLEGKENPLNNGRTQSISYPLGAEPWSWGKNNGEQEKVRALRQQLQIQEGLGGSGHASASISESTVMAPGKVGPQAGSLPAIDFVSRSRVETGPWSSAQLMDVHSMDSSVPMLLAGFTSHLKGAAQMFASQNNPSDERAGNIASASKGAPVAQLSEILQQHGMPEQHMQREVHLQKQQEARKKRKMLIDEQKQQKKAKEDDRSPLCNGSMATTFHWPGSSQWPRSWEAQTVLSSLDHNGDPEQPIEAFPASQVLDQTVKDAGVSTDEGLPEDRVGATMIYIQKLRGEEAAPIPMSNCHSMLLPGSNDDIRSNTSSDKLEGANGKSAIFQSTQEEPSPIVVQHIQTQSQCATMKPGIVATLPSTVKPGSHGSMPPSELKLQHQDCGSDAVTSFIAAVEASQSFPATVAVISVSATKLSVGEGLDQEDAASQLPRDVRDESTTSGNNPLEIIGRSGKLESHPSLPAENSNVKGASGFWQLGTTRGIPGMDILSREPYNLRPGIAVGQTFGGTGSSPELPWVSSSSLNGKAVSGVVYRLIHGPIRIVCACHGKHMTPDEFSKHGASLDSPDKDATLVMGTFSDCTEATSAKA